MICFAGEMEQALIKLTEEDPFYCILTLRSQYKKLAHHLLLWVVAKETMITG